MGRSWAQIVEGGGAGSKDSAAFSEDHKDNIEKLKTSVRDMVYIDDDFCERAFGRMQNSLFRKFLRKAFLLEQIKLALSNLWKKMGEFSIAEAEWVLPY